MIQVILGGVVLLMLVVFTTKMVSYSRITKAAASVDVLNRKKAEQDINEYAKTLEKSINQNQEKQTDV